MKKEKLEKYLKEELNLSNDGSLADYLNSGEAEQSLHDKMQDLWDEEVRVEPENGFKDTLDTVKSHITASKRETWRRRMKIKSFIGVAASVALISFFALNSVFFKPTGHLSEPQNNRITKVTSKGLKSTVHLKDGSKVMINSESQVEYAKFFSDSARVVHLDGEAFFEVAKDKSRPFIVVANGVSVTALGTSFNINSRGDLCKVSLATGKVGVRQQADSRSYFLKPGEALEFNTLTGEMTSSTFEGSDDFLWKEGIIAFDNDDLETILFQLERWYDVGFEVENMASAKRYTGRFDNKSLETILDNMSFALGFDYFIHEKKVKIIFENHSLN